MMNFVVCWCHLSLEKMPYFSWGAIRTEWALCYQNNWFIFWLTWFIILLSTWFIYFLIDLILFPKNAYGYIIESMSLIIFHNRVIWPFRSTSLIFQRESIMVPDSWFTLTVWLLSFWEVDKRVFQSEFK